MRPTRFYVNRGGGRVPEGPFEEQQIVRFILAGKLRSGYISELGSQRFFLLDTHPPFAEALEQAGVPPTADALDAKKKAESAARRAAQPRAPRNRATILGAILAFLGLAIGAVAIGAYVMFNNGAMSVHAALPSDTEVLLEVGNVRDVVRDIGWLRSVDTKQFNESQLLDDAALDLSASFGIAKTRANSLLLAASSVGAAARKLASVPEGGVVLTFSDATPVNALFNTERFTYTGLVSSNGRKYKLASAGSSEPGATGGVTLRALTGLELDTARTVLVWFETSKVLFIGSPSFAKDVARALSLDAPSLALSPSFQKAQHDFADKSDAVGYFDGASLISVSDPRLKAFFEGRKAEPAAVSLKLVPAGLVAHVVARFTVPASASAAPAPAPMLAPGQPLTVIDRLPSETFAYVAAVTKTRLSGAELRRALLGQLAKSAPDTAEQVTSQLSRIEAQLHLSADQVLSSIGDQAALALLAPADYSLALGQPAQMVGNLAAFYVQAVKDEAPAQVLLTELQTKLGAFANLVRVQRDADGLSLVPSDAALGVSAQIRIIKGYLCVALGNPALVERSLRAASSGEGALVNEPAHRAARAALPGAYQLFAWLDVGRLVSTVLKNPLLSPRVHDFGLDRGGVRWTGPERVTAALAFSEELQNGVYTDRVDTLNLAAFAGVFGTGL